MRIRYWRFLRRRTNEAIELVVHDLTDCEWPSPDYSPNRTSSARSGFASESSWTVSAFGRSRPAADASREVVERWLLDGLDVSVGHRRCSCDPSSQNNAGRTPAP
jgi:hypothetical protein